LLITTIAGAIAWVLLYHLALSGQAEEVEQTQPRGQVFVALLTEQPGFATDLYYTGPLTFTPVATIYLPIVSNDNVLVSLDDVTDWVYQLQNLDLTAVGATAYDLVVIDYSADGDDETAFTPAEIATLKNSPGGDKIVLAYMSIGEAEDYRFYWQSEWTPGNPL
jgi:uncharacterized protein (TIGR01370 family)